MGKIDKIVDPESLKDDELPEKGVFLFLPEELKKE